MYGLLPEGTPRTRSALARATHVSRNQLIAWFDGKGEPRMSALEEAAAQLDVRRVDLVAAYDGVIAPDTETPAAPQIEERLDALMRRDEVLALVQQVERRVTDEVVKNREAVVTALASELGDRVAETLAALPEQLRAALAHAVADRGE